MYKLCKTTCTHLQGHCARRGGGADFSNYWRLTSFFHAVTVRVVHEVAQTPYQVKIFVIVIKLLTTVLQVCVVYSNSYNFLNYGRCPDAYGQEELNVFITSIDDNQRVGRLSM